MPTACFAPRPSEARHPPATRPDRPARLTRRALARALVLAARVATGVAALGAVVPQSAGAQVVRGVVIDDGSGQPVSGAVVVLLDAQGRRVVGVLAGEDGRYALRASVPGRYRLRAERIGFRSDTPREVTLASGETAEIRLVTRPIPVTLGAVQINSRSGCVAGAADGREVAAVWEEARKALYATELTQQQALFSAHVSRFERSLDPRNGRVLTHQVSEMRGVTRNPFVSLSAARLSAEGYLRADSGAMIYYGPDASVLSSDEFLRDHCFRLRRGSDTRDGLIGLAFEPVADRRASDIAGTLWIDARSAELRDLEFTYTRVPDLPAGVRSDEFGGRTTFRRMPSGAWIVERWVIRMPVLGAGPPGAREMTAIPGVVSPPARQSTLVAIREEGGEVVETVALGVRQASVMSRATVGGVLFDSTLLAPLPNARVFLDGTQFATRSAADGAFRIDGVPPGTYTVSVMHPRFDSLGITPPADTVTITAGETVVASLAGPSPATLAARYCVPGALSRGAGVLRGRVVDAETGAPAIGAPVAVSWGSGAAAAMDHRVSTRTDSAGRYVACGLPVGSAVTARAVIGAGRSATTQLTIAASGITVLDLSIGSAGTSSLVASRSAPPADTVGVAGTRPAASRAMEGFERRRRRANGAFVTRAQVDRMRSRRFTDLVRMVPGVSVRADEERGGAMIVEIRSAVRAAGNRTIPVQPDSTLPLPAGEVRPNDMVRTQPRLSCAAGYYLDAMPFDPGGSIDLEIKPEDIEGIEIYPQGQVPAEFLGRPSACGVIVIWTRTYAERESPAARPDGGR